MKILKTIDLSILRLAYQRPYKESVLTKSLIFIGDGPFWMVAMFVSAIIGQVFESVSFERLTIVLMFGLMISNLVFGPLKKNIHRRRPYADHKIQDILNIKIINRDPGHGSKELESFPSGHALWTSLCVCLICHEFGYIAVLAIGWLIPAMMFLRIHLGVHYPSDVVAGFVIGVINACFTVNLAPVIIGIITGVKDHELYIFGYWMFILFFLVVGFRSWLKRV